MNLDSPVASSEIKGAEDSALAQLVQKVVNTWDGENIWFCDSVEGPVIYTKPQCAILLPDKYHRASPVALDRQMTP